MGIVLDNNLALTSVTRTTYPPRLGVNNLFRASEGTVTVSAEDTADDGHKENAYAEGFTHDFWKPGSSGDHWIRVSLTSSAKANYLGIAAHDLHNTGATVKAQYSTDGGSTWNDAHSGVTPGNAQPLMVLFTEVEAADWRLFVSSTSAVSIGVVHIGAVLEMESPIEGPWQPPYLARDVRYINDRTDGGAFVGRSIISKGVEFRLTFRLVDMGWLRDTWEPTLRSIEQYPFFFAARDLDPSGLGEQEVVYAWTTRQPTSGYDNNVTGEQTIRCRGIID